MYESLSRKLKSKEYIHQFPMNDHNIQFSLLSTTREHMYLLHDNSEVFLIHPNIWVRQATDHVWHYVVDGITLMLNHETK